ncbi:MAG: DUF4173 domain-containing protein [Paracoccaceae bacterium]
MNTQLVINGLPEKLRLDAWWLSCETPPKPLNMGVHTSNSDNTGIAAPRRYVLILVLGLVALSDWLFWHQKAGASVAIFAILLSIAMMLARPQKTTRKEWGIVIGLTIGANLPLLEQLQPLSLMFSLLGVVATASWLAMDTLVGWGRGFVVFLKITIFGPVQFFGALGARLREVRPQSGLGRQAASLVLPLTFGIVFISFFVSANPFLERIMNTVAEIEFITPDAVARALFWIIAAAFLWPYLNLPMFRIGELKRKTSRPKTLPQGLSLVINAASIRTSLILFNGIFALQTGLDFLVLSGGMALPEGMSYASYAHRGAYPLVATALLAGAFAIGTRSWIMQDRLLRGLVYVWLLQNLFLVLSAVFRLNLYVETYALTYLRVAAFIWMLLVFIGLLLVAMQIARNKSNIWLMSQNLTTLLVVLYLSSFANFAPMIARYNILHPLSNGQVDAAYICRMGPQALPVILAQGPGFCTVHTIPKFTPAAGWRDWGFRKARLAGYLEVKLQTGAL